MNQVLAPDRSTDTTIGSLLRSARLQRNLSLEEIAQRTFIKLHYLQALEDDQFDRLPAPVYTSGYIRQVARLLGLDDAPLIQRYHQHRQPQLQDGLIEAPSTFTPVLEKREGRRSVDTIRLMTQTAQTFQGEASQPMEPTTVQPVAGQKQVIETIEGARKEALAMRHQTEQFADQVLLHLEQEIQKTLGIVRNGRSYLQKRLNSYQF